ncbi:MAG TPA: class I SAM-dependent methyltransferase [Daejeonella sp.]|nr:class I SAM-dependent methyltransferase [Daejeonella sp.]
MAYKLLKLKSLTLGNLVRKRRILVDRFFGLDFLTVIHPEDVGLDSKNAFRSSPSGDGYLKNLLRDFNISSQDSIIDIGCGKGSAMRTMLEFPFKRVDGIELSDHIATIATRNFAKLNVKRCRIFVGDASQFKKFDNYNMVYFYNPFPSNVMLDVIDAIIQSIYRLDRELVIIYNNATCHDTVVGKGIFSKMGVYPDKWGNLISIYSNRSFDNSRLFMNRSMRRITENLTLDERQL